MGSSTRIEAPKPDPAIAQAAAQQGALGREQLDFAKQQFAAGEKRQDSYDILAGKVADSALASQEKAEQWAQQDRDMGRATQGYLDGVANAATTSGEMYENTFAKIAQEQSTFGKEEMGRYKEKFRPVQDRIVSDAMGWDSAERLASESGKAKADVLGNAAQMREASARQMASMGVDPRSGRFAGVDRAGGLNTALAAAGAQNLSRDNVLSQAQTLRGQAGQLGQQVLANGQQANSLSMAAVTAGQAARQSGQQLAMQAKAGGLNAGNAGLASAGLGLSAGGAATGAAGSANANFYANNGIMNGGFAGAQSGLGGMASTLGGLYGNQMNAWQAQQQAAAQKSSGIGSMVGTIAGAGIMAF